MTDRKNARVKFMMDVKGKKVSVIGAARSGIAAANLLTSKGAEVFVSDTAPVEKKEEEIRKLQSIHVPFEFGQHSQQTLAVDFMVVSPGVPMNLSIVTQAMERNIPVFSEIEIASWFCSSPIIAITGSNGKTTTTTLLGEIYREAGIPHLVTGNIGYPFSEAIQNGSDKNVVILEVSSFQLEGIQSFKPKISAILNLSPNHLDRYATYTDYVQAKLRIFEYQDHHDRLVINTDDDYLNSLVSATRPFVVKFSAEERLEAGCFVEKGAILWKMGTTMKEEIIHLDEIGIPGLHNVYNVLAASCIAKLDGIKDNEAIYRAIKNFKGVEHRLEFVREYHGVKYINDSKSTTVQSVWYALQSYAEPILLIMGGKDKGGEFSRLGDLVRKQVREIVLIGEAADRIQKELEGIVPIKRSESLEQAVDICHRDAKEGQLVLLSPGCASFDMFQDYEDRGRQFKRRVNSL
jgi:UDP-N-acetylmuramoylalanine--D-glutamate ligase